MHRFSILNDSDPYTSLEDSDAPEAMDTDGLDALAQATAPLSAQISLDMAGMRLDKALVELFPDYTRNRLQTWLEAGLVTLDGQPQTKTSHKVRAGQYLVLTPEAPPELLAMQAQEMPLDIVYEDDDCLVVNKTPDRVVHPAPGNWDGTLMNGLLFHAPELFHVPRAGIVHRLDKETSGLMVVAKTLQAQTHLVAQLQQRTVQRLYCAVVWGRIQRPLTVNQPIGRDPRSKIRMAVVQGAKEAITHFLPIAHGTVRDLPVSLLCCKLETGRTHQIRVHALHSGFSLLGDPVYRQPKVPTDAFDRQALHAFRLSFEQPGGLGWVVNQIDMAPDVQGLLLSAGIDVSTQTIWEQAREHWELDD